MKMKSSLPFFFTVVAVWFVLGQGISPFGVIFCHPYVFFWNISKSQRSFEGPTFFTFGSSIPFVVPPNNIIFPLNWVKVCPLLLRGAICGSLFFHFTHRTGFTSASIEFILFVIS